MELIHTLLDLLAETLTITCLVMVMMLLVEFLNVASSGHLLGRLQRRPMLQVVVASLLGLIPGCVGGFTVVSLYSHRLLSFGALVAGMVSTFGDSAFLLFALSPATTPKLLLSLLAVALAAGALTHLIFRNRPFYTSDEHTLELHEAHAHSHGKVQLSFGNIKQISFARATLLFGLTIYLVVLCTGAFAHEHGGTAPIGHGENIVFGILALLTLVVVAFSSEHFLQEHLWEHVIKRHFLSVLLWTFGVLAALAVLWHFFDVAAVLQGHRWVTWALLFVALGLGIIPESQPQFIWIYLYASGLLPFSILLASSIVQDGHGALPLLAYSRKSFFMMKAVNLVFGLLVGVAGILLNF